MYRGPFLHGLLRFSNVKNKNNRRYKPASPVRKFVNTLCLILGLAVIVAVIALDLTQIFLIGAIFFFTVGAIPFFMSLGKNMVMYEQEIAVNQKRAEMVLDFNRKRVILGFFLMFTPLYILMLGCFLLPFEGAWIVPYIPLFVFTLIAAMLSQHSAEIFEFSAKKYKKIHVLLFIGTIILGTTLRISFIIPYLETL